ncbi:MAG: signal recognition particle-docking protein FtsY [Buchnera aphidicola (Nurudea yanoniella)]
MPIGDKKKFKKFLSWFSFKKKNHKENNKNYVSIKKNSNYIENVSELSTTCEKKNVFLKKIENNSSKCNESNLCNLKDINISTIPKKQGVFSTLIKKLSKTQENLGLKIQNLFFKKIIKDSFFDDVSDQLIMSDVGVETTNELINTLKNIVDYKNLKDTKIILSIFKQVMIDMLKKVEKPLKIKNKKPFSILVIGVNGVGKTSIIGKLAHKFKKSGKSVILAAGDTFRAAAVDQLKILGNNSSIPVISQKSGADPASVVFDAFQAAQSKNIDILIADTSGRLQNKINLIEELKKIKRVMKKLDPIAPDEVILVLDACIGQNSINQAIIFKKELGVTGLVVTKLDGTSKGGVIFSIAKKLSIPIRYISFGEKISEIDYFNSDKFINAIFSKNI